MSTHVEVVKENANWFIALGVLWIVLGVIAIAVPALATLTLEILIGILFIVGAVGQIIQAFKAQKWQGFLLQLVLGVLYGIAGIFLLNRPLLGAITLTLILAIFFIVEGLFRSTLAFNVRPNEGWIWLLISGIVSALLGVMILAAFDDPMQVAWVIGLLVGINLVFNGWSLVMLSSAVKNAVSD